MAKTSQDSMYYGNAIVKAYDDSRRTFAVATNQVIATGAGVLVGVSLNTNGGTVTLYDNTAPSGTSIGIIASDAPEGFFPFGIAFTTGLTVTNGSTTNCTIVYRGTSSVSSASLSPSTSVSPSSSASVSPSESPSVSASASVSPSTSVSASSSASISPSTSVSNSTSPSISPSTSVSNSASSSVSPSQSPSVSPSTSVSASGSKSSSASPST
jgi:hypothetical protein